MLTGCDRCDAETQDNQRMSVSEQNFYLPSYHTQLTNVSVLFTMFGL